MSNSKSSSLFNATSGRSGGSRRSSGRAGVYDLRMRPHHNRVVQALLLVWRWRVELLTTAAVLIGILWMHKHIGPTWTLVELVLVTAIILAVRPLRRWLVAHVWCTVTRHRLRLFFVEGGVYNRSGRLPWILWVRPTPVGERAWIRMPAALSGEQFDGELQNLASTCFARDARYTPVRAVVTYVRVDIVRHDPLTTTKRTKPIRSDLLGATADYGSTDLPDTPAAAHAATKAAASATATSRTVGLARPATPPAPRTPRDPAGTTPPTTTAPAGSAPPAVLNKHGEDISDYVD